MKKIFKECNITGVKFGLNEDGELILTDGISNVSFKDSEANREFLEFCYNEAVLNRIREKVDKAIQEMEEGA